MNGKKLLLIACLACAWSTLAPAQGLVGAPVDPRYGSTPAIAAQSKNPPASPSVQATFALAVLAALRAVLR